MYPFIIQSIAAEHAREIRESVQHDHDVSLARSRRRRLRQAARASGSVRPLPARLRLLMS